MCYKFHSIGWNDMRGYFCISTSTLFNLDINGVKKAMNIAKKS